MEFLWRMLRTMKDVILSLPWKRSDSLEVLGICFDRVRLVPFSAFTDVLSLQLIFVTSAGTVQR